MTGSFAHEEAIGGPFEERFRLLLESGQATEDTIAATKAALRLVEKHYAIQLNEELGAVLATHIASTTKRLLDGQTLFQLPDVAWQEIQAYPEELALAVDLVVSMEHSLGTSIPQDEVGFVAVHLCAIRQKIDSSHQE
jgi:transcriptional regulatory protein LevR